MKRRYSKLVSATAVTVIASLLLLVGLPNSQAKIECHPDQVQLQNQGAIGLGGRTVLGQTFVPGAPGQQVCQVKVHINKNLAAAGNLTLHLLRSNLAELDAAVTIPGGLIPMGPSVQVFNFGCNGAALAGNPFYGLKLESQGSPVGAYSWRGIGGNPYARPGAAGRGWRNVNAGAGNWTALGAWDFAFQIYMCD